MSSHSARDLGPLPKEHPREGVLLLAQQELYVYIHGLRHRHNLTSAEFMSVLTHVLDSFAMALVRVERRVPSSEEKGESGGEISG